MTSVLLDTNLLLLFLIGTFNRARIARFKRTQRYSERDFDILADFVIRFDRQATTPHVLTEVSNLCGGLSGLELKKARLALELLAAEMDEQYLTATELCQTREYARLGLADAAVLQAKADVVVTDDTDLYIALRTRGLQATKLTELHRLA